MQRAGDVAGVPLERLAHVDHEAARVAQPDGLVEVDLPDAHGAEPPPPAWASTSASSGQVTADPVTAPCSTL